MIQIFASVQHLNAEVVGWQVMKDGKWLNTLESETDGFTERIFKTFKQ